MVVGILGLLHDDVMREKYDCKLDQVEKFILEYNPDIICGEVRPEDWEAYCNDRTYKGYLGPSEYRGLIIPFCEKHNIQFEPVDWFERDLKFNYTEGYTEEEIEMLGKEFDKIYDNIFKNAHLGTIPFNSIELDELIRRKKDRQRDVNPSVYHLEWTCRNLIMVERIKNVLKQNEGKRVLCTVGMEHNYFYYDELKKTNWEVVYPIK